LDDNRVTRLDFSSVASPEVKEGAVAALDPGLPGLAITAPGNALSGMNSAIRQDGDGHWLEEPDLTGSAVSASPMSSST
jgi:hypothetical protein